MQRLLPAATAEGGERGGQSHSTARAKSPSPWRWEDHSRYGATEAIEGNGLRAPSSLVEAGSLMLSNCLKTARLLQIYTIRTTVLSKKYDQVRPIN